MFRFQLERKKKEGTYKTKKQKEQEAKAEAAKAAMLAAGLEGEAALRNGSDGLHQVEPCSHSQCSRYFHSLSYGSWWKTMLRF